MPVERVGREAVALLEHEPDLVVPVDVVGRERDEPGGRATRRRAAPCRHRRAPPRARRRRRRSGSAGVTARSTSGAVRVLASDRRNTAGGSSADRVVASSHVPSSMYVRSAASASSASGPAKQLPGSTRAKIVRADRSRRFNVRVQYSATSRTSQSSARSSTSSPAATRRRSRRRCRRRVRSTHVPTSVSLNRRCSIASSSSRAAAMIHASLPASTSSAGVIGCGVLGARTVMWAAPSSRSIDTSTLGYEIGVAVDRPLEGCEHDADAHRSADPMRRHGRRPDRRRAR